MIPGKSPWIYVAGPYSGREVDNTRAAISTATQIRIRGGTPIVPHTCLVWALVEPADYEWWLKLDLDYLSRCDALYRLPGESPGADREVAFAVGQGIPVIRGWTQLCEWIDDHGGSTAPDLVTSTYAVPAPKPLPEGTEMTLRFRLPERQTEALTALSAGKLVGAICEIREWLRSARKYGIQGKQAEMIDGEEMLVRAQEAFYSALEDIPDEVIE